MEPAELSPTGQRLFSHIKHAYGLATKPPADPVHVKGVASGVYFVYEQLRNAADSTQRHLLLRAAIERFLRRSVYVRDPITTTIAEDLVIELTQARYIKNDTVAKKTLRDINRLVGQYSTFFAELITKHGVPPAKATAWVYQILSVLIKRHVDPQPINEGLLDTEYNHYLAAIDRNAFKQLDDQTFAIVMYCAVHRSLAKSDIATARTYWLLAHPTAPFDTLCQAIDTYFDHPQTNRLTRLINRNATPMRSITALFRQPDIKAELLYDLPQMLIKLEATITRQYETIRDTTIQSLWRMVIFVFITKTVIGIAIEIPYDLLALGHIAVVPLLVNLLFPPLFMMSAAFGLKPPRRGNTKAILVQSERILYATKSPLTYKIKRTTTSKNTQLWFNTIYTITFLVPFGLVVWALAALGFTWLHGVIFFIFLSGVSFFRFRLLQSAHEMDGAGQHQSLAGTVADFLYMPFIRLGYWLSDRYQRLNLITFLLDMAIELPLKTSLRVLRQWAGFINDKRDEL